MSVQMQKSLQLLSIWSKLLLVIIPIIPCGKRDVFF